MFKLYNNLGQILIFRRLSEALQEHRMALHLFVNFYLFPNSVFEFITG